MMRALWRWLNSWFSVPSVPTEMSSPPQLIQYPEGIPVEQTEDGKRWALLMTRTCPHCKFKGGNFIEGPSGGMSTNIQCEQCGWWFNVTPALGLCTDIGTKD